MPTIGDQNEQIKEERQLTIHEQQKFFVAKSNELIQKSRFSMSVQQNRIMLYLISKIKPNDFGDEVYQISVREFCKVCNLDYNSGKNYADAKRAIKAIADKSVWVQQENGDDVLLRWLNRVKLNRETGCFEITFHEDMLPFLYDLQSRYTRYSLDNVLTMKSKYGIRLYELLKSYQYLGKSITFTVDELRHRLDAEKYTRFPDFRRYVLEKAIDDINECSDIQVGYMPIKTNGKRATDSVVISIKEPTSEVKAARKRLKKYKLSEEKKAEINRRIRRYQKYIKKLEDEEEGIQQRFL